MSASNGPYRLCEIVLLSRGLTTPQSVFRCVPAGQFAHSTLVFLLYDLPYICLQTVSACTAVRQLFAQQFFRLPSQYPLSEHSRTVLLFRPYFGLSVENYVTKLSPEKSKSVNIMRKHAFQFDFCVVCLSAGTQTHAV